MADFGNYIFGLNNLVVTTLDGVTQVDLDAALKLTFKGLVTTERLRGDDQIKAVVTIQDGVEWSIEAGGLPLDAVALMQGRTVVESGTTPSQTATLTASGAEAFPYFKIYGKALGDKIGDLHMLLYKCKLESDIEGDLGDASFMMTKCNGVGLDDGSSGVYDLVQNETATTLPAT